MTDRPISVKELSIEYEKTPFFKVHYKRACSFTNKRRCFEKIEDWMCEDYLVIDDALLKIPKDKIIEPLSLLVISGTYVPTNLYKYHNSLLLAH